jgi:hypothetical protein
VAKVFDLDALAVEAESAEPFRFRWDGHEFALPLLQQMTWQDSVAYFADDATPDAKLRRLLGAPQYEQFTAKPMSTARLNALLDAWFAAQGTSAGESVASSPS